MGALWLIMLKTACDENNNLPQQLVIGGALPELSLESPSLRLPEFTYWENYWKLCRDNKDNQDWTFNERDGPPLAVEVTLPESPITTDSYGR